MDSEQVLHAILCAIIIAVVGGISYFVSVKECDVQAQSFKSHDYSIIGGCMVTTDAGKVLPLKNYREME